MKKFIFFIAAMSALLSCVKENPVSDTPVADTPVVETPAEETFSVEIRATAPSDGDDAVAAHSNTKTTLVEGGKFVHWSKGDAIKVLLFPNRSNGNTVTGPSGVFTSHFDAESSAEAYFRTDSWLWAGIPHDIYNDQRKNRLAGTGVAVYPSTATAFSNKTTSSTSAALTSEISFVLPEEQNAVVGNIESGLNFSYADVNRDSFINTVDKGSTTELYFKNACALIQLTMPAEMPKVTEIAITSNDKVALTGHGSMKLSYYLDGLELDNEDKATVIVSDGKNVVLKSADGFKAGAKYYAVVWPGVHNSGLTIEFMAEDGTVATKTTPSVTLTASMVKPYTFSKGLEFVAPVKEFNYFYADGGTGNEVNSNIVGVVIFRGNPKTQFNDPDLPDQYCNGLAISTKNVMTSWGGPSAVSNQPQDAKVAISLNDIPNTNGGYTIKNVWANNNFDLPIYNNTSYADLSSCNTSGWYLGTKNEWSYIHSNLAEINTLLTATGADAIQTVTSESTNSTSRNTIWMPFWCVAGSKSYYAVTGYFDYYGNLKFAYNFNYSYSRIARPIFAF